LNFRGQPIINVETTSVSINPSDPDNGSSKPGPNSSTLLQLMRQFQTNEALLPNKARP
jgi:hypothetical protein